MLDEYRQRIDQLLRLLGGDEAAFNRIAETERLNVYLRHGRIYPASIGQTHTGRLARELLYGQPAAPITSSPLAEEALRLTA